ncbi:hypothetical protein [Yoonia algicola]|uniref:Uncharacterized protein n=1 Tax=Yoonia algicola TaxID=3137368 RepID=A0AAN0M4V8_9RHOB
MEWLFCSVCKSRPIDRDLSTTTIKRIIKTAAQRAGFDPSDIAAVSGYFRFERSMFVGDYEQADTRQSVCGPA